MPPIGGGREAAFRDVSSILELTPDVPSTIAINFADVEQTTDSPGGPIIVGPRRVRVVH
ncbi:MAG: hypothetical protein ABIK89_04520 [Planctomycetota bacterium]